MAKISLDWTSSSRLAGMATIAATALLFLGLTGPSQSAASAAARQGAQALESARIPCPAPDFRQQPTGGMDFDVDFKPDTFSLTQESEPVLNDLSNALNSAQLSGFHFAAIAHVEALGDKVSEERATVLMATAVIDYLVDEGGVDPNRLVWSACGALQPSEAKIPASLRNRRVEIVNMGVR